MGESAAERLRGSVARHHQAGEPLAALRILDHARTADEAALHPVEAAQAVAQRQGFTALQDYSVCR